jgi:hypothetical protein
VPKRSGQKGQAEMRLQKVNLFAQWTFWHMVTILAHGVYQHATNVISLCCTHKYSNLFDYSK